jgi:small GTP-binding protein
VPRAILNLGILAHVDAGKTTLTERLLYCAGVIDEPGSVDEGTTQTDSLALERQRGITIKSAVASFTVDGVGVNLIDTPGHPDFVAEVERALSVLDGVVLVISAVEGVQPQTRILWRALQRLGIPTLFFVNKIDRRGAGYQRLLDDISERLTTAIIPMGAVSGLGTRDAAFVPDDGADPAAVSRRTEVLAEHDDAVLAAYLDDDGAPGGWLDRKLAGQVRDVLVHPVFFGSAITGAGVDTLLHGLARLLPAAGGDDRGPVSGRVFKVDRGPGGDKIAYARVFSGSIAVRDRVPFGHGGGGGGDGGGGGGLGGAVFLRLGALRLAGDTFTGNAAVKGTGANDGKGKGGALFINAGASISGCATFSGNSATDAAGSGSDTNDFFGAIVPAACTTLSLSAPGSGTTGTAISPTSITAKLSGATAAASGTITFRVIGPQSSPPADCTSGGTVVGTATVSGAGSYHPSAGFTPAQPGTYWWYASYSGDTDNTNSDSGCGTGMKSTVIPAPPTVQITAPGDGATYVQGQAVSSSFSCSDGANGPGLLSCLDRNDHPSGSAVDTSTVGSHLFTVTATSKDGQTSSRSVTYQVVAQSGPPPPPSNQFVVKQIKVRADGLVSFDAKVPGPGAINVLETAWKNNFATAATLLQPATGRFEFARSHRTATRASTVHFKVKPNKRGQRLVAHHRYKVTIRLWVTYQPTGGTQRKVGFYGLRITR